MPHKIWCTGRQCSWTAVFYQIVITQGPLESIILVVKHPKSQTPFPTPFMVQNDDSSQLRTHLVSTPIVTICKYHSNEVPHTVDCYDNSSDLARVLCKCSHRRETIPASSRVPLSAERFFGSWSLSKLAKSNFSKSSSSLADQTGSIQIGACQWLSFEVLRCRV